ncbi:MAG: DNA helicase RecG, partial [Anaerolineae bacterium]|nr:DNA helicase RecG [Anaerolineae bacterium]
QAPEKPRWLPCKPSTQPLTAISGVGPAVAEKLERVGFGPRTVGELLYLFPRRYDDYTRMLPLNRVAPHQQVAVVGTVRSIAEVAGNSGRKRIIVTVEDSTKKMQVTFFNQPWLLRQIKPGMQLVFSGKADLYRDQVGMTNPEWEPVDQESLNTGRIVPVYPLTQGLGDRTMRRLMYELVEKWAPTVPDFLPPHVLDRTEQVDLAWALRQAHFPEKWEYLAYARERLAFNELIMLQLSVMAHRAEWQGQRAVPLPMPPDWLAAFEARLPFRLTEAQRRAIAEIQQDVVRDVPMNRLLQGDVGAGKPWSRRQRWQQPCSMASKPH